DRDIDAGRPHRLARDPVAGDDLRRFPHVPGPSCPGPHSRARCPVHERHAAPADLRNPLRHAVLLRRCTGHRPARVHGHGGVGQVPPSWRGHRMTSGVTDLPTWAAVLVAVLVLTGSLLTLLGSIGLVRLKTFY